MALLNSEDGLNGLVCHGLLEATLQFGHVKALADLVRGNDGVAVLIGDVGAGLLLRGVAHLLVVTLTLVNLKEKNPKLNLKPYLRLRNII